MSFAVTATDADAGQMTTLSAQGMPLGASFIPSTGQFNWTPGIAGSFVIGFTVIDNGSPVLSQTKTVTITVAPPASSPNGFWTSTSGLIGAGNINSLLSAGTTVYASGDTSVYRSTDNGLSWAKIGTSAINANASSFKLLAANGSKLYLKSNYGLHRSNDNGATWTAISTGLTVAGSNASTMLVNGTTLFLGDASYGIWRSSDDGTTWSQVFSNSNVSSFVSTGSTIFAGLAGSGVLRSTNNGASWTGVNSGLTNFSVNSLALNGVTLFAGTNLGVFRSIDSGTSWTAVNTGLPANLTVNDLKAGNNFIYAGTASGVYFSANNGGNWTVMDAGETPTSVTSLAITNTKIFARNQLGVVITSLVPTISSNATPVLTVPAAQNATTTNALTFTVSATDANAGQTITLSAAGLPSGATFNAATGQFSWTPNAPATVVVGFTATDSGAPQLSDTKTVTINATGISPSGNWQNVSPGSQLSVTTLTVLGTEVFVGTSNGVHKTTNDGQTWTAANSGIPANTYIYSLSVVNGNIYAGANGVLYTSNDGGASWVSISNGLSGIVMTVAANGATLLAGTNGFGVYRSTNGGSTWTSSSTGLPATSRVSTVLVSGTNIFASLGNLSGGTGGVYLSTDGGLNWTPVNTGLPASGLLVYSIVLKDASIYAATQSGLYVTLNNGTSWTVVVGGLPVTGNNALSLAVSGSNLLVGYFFGTPIYATTNGGTSWSAMTVGENVSYVSSIVVKGNKVFAVNSNGVGGTSVFVSPVPGT